MTNPLPTLYRERAEHAVVVPDLDDVLAEIRERSEQQTRRRRNLAAAGGGSVAIVALVTAALVITSGDDRDDTAAPPASRVASAPPAAPARLVAVAPAPKSAPLSVSLVPRGYRYISSVGNATGYGPAGATREPNDFRGKVTLLVGERYDTKKLPDRIAGYPATITRHPASDKDFAWSVNIAYNRKILLTIQVPPATGLTRADVRRLANTLDVRDVSHPARG